MVILERFVISIFQGLCWAALHIAVLIAASMTCFFAFGMIFEGEYSIGALSFYEVAFIMLLLLVLNRSWKLHSESGHGLINYLYRLCFTLAVLFGVILVFFLILPDFTNRFISTPVGELTFFISFLLGVYMAAKLEPVGAGENETETVQVCQSDENKVSQQTSGHTSDQANANKESTHV